jgi:hypothetical protein
MKKLIVIGLSFLLIVKLSGQTQGINYQAVIIDKTPQEVPGRDITGNIIPNQPVIMRFSILDAAGTIEYQEEHSVTTDMYGMINLVIGKGIQTVISPNAFSDIDWNGTTKSLKVDLSLSDTDIFYTDFSFEDLTFVPYAYHRNITATGSLIVDGMTALKSRVDVTDGSPTFLSGNLTVDELTTLNNDLTVNAQSSLKGQVTINPDFSSPGNKSSYESYPLRVEGGNQGIAVKIDGSRSSDNYFVTFWDDERIQGRIEGQTTTELLTDPEYIFDNVLFANEVIRSTVDVAKAAAAIVSASSSSTVCAGLGACVTAPVPSLIAGAIAELVMESANLALVITEPILYNVFKHTNIGVTYQSGAGDYAEWLPKSDPAGKFSPGDIVGVKGGYISGNTGDADHLMVISRNPIILGNMPEEGKEAEYEKVAFMGQVPVLVYGKVQPGDFILPGGNNNGAGMAVSPDDIQPGQYSKIVGVAWSGSESSLYGYVNVVVGMNAGYMAQLNEKQEKKIKEQEAEINDLKKQLNMMNNALAQLVPNYSALMESGKGESTTVLSPVPASAPLEERTVVYYEITREQILEGISLAEKTLKEKGVELDTHPFFKKMTEDPEYKECFISDALASVKNEMEKYYKDDMKSGAKVIKLTHDAE